MIAVVVVAATIAQLTIGTQFWVNEPHTTTMLLLLFLLLSLPKI